MQESWNATNEIISNQFTTLLCYKIVTYKMYKFCRLCNHGAISGHMPLASSRAQRHRVCRTLRYTTIHTTVSRTGDRLTHGVSRANQPASTRVKPLTVMVRGGRGYISPC